MTTDLNESVALMTEADLRFHVLDLLNAQGSYVAEIVRLTARIAELQGKTEMQDRGISADRLESGAMNKVATTLRRARELIAEPERWTQGQLAMTVDGKACDPKSPAAVAWCFMGAIWCAAPNEVTRLFARRPAERVVGTSDLACWNDDPIRTHAEVLAACDRAIAAAEVVT